MRMPMPHPKASKTERRNVLTGTDMVKLMRGEWRKVWDEKRGNTEPENLDHIWQVRLGLATEKLHAIWHQHQTGDAVFETEDRPCYFPDVDIPGYHAATYDSWVATDDCPLEMKHTYARNTLVEAAQYYMPQIQWQLHVSGCGQLRFSIIRGNQEPEWGYVARDATYIAMLLETATAFWQMVQDNVPPEDMASPNEPAIAAAKQIPINGYKGYDLSDNNEWSVLEAQWCEQKQAAADFKDTDKQLRALIPADALEVKGKLTLFKRDARGAYRSTILEDE
jgi:hypothetical protein